MSWPSVSLAEIADLVRGVTFSKDDICDDGEDTVPLLRAGNIQDQLVINEDLVFLPVELVSERQMIKPNDIVMCMSSGSANVLGKSAIAIGEWYGSFGAFLAVIRPDPIKVDAAFLSHFFRNTSFRTWASSSNGIGIKNIRLSDLSEFKIPLPPLEEQKRIAAILDQADELRRLRARALEKLNTLGQAIFQEMFGETQSIREVGFEDIADFQVGHPFKSANYTTDSTGIRLCRGANVLPNEIDWSNGARYPVEALGGLEKFGLEENDVVIAMDRPWISTGFKSARISLHDLPAYLVQRVARLRAREPFDQAFLKAVIESTEFQTHCKPTETTVPHISPVEIKTFRFKLPPEDVRRRYDQAARALSKNMISHRSALNETEALFASLQSAAFQGKL